MKVREKKNRVGTSWIPQRQIDELRNSLRLGELSLYLGAGVSLPYGIPTWQDLVVGLLLTEDGKRFRRFYPHYRMALATWLATNFEFSPMSLARVVKKRLTGGSNESNKKFLVAVRDKLYDEYIHKWPDDTLLDAVAELISSGPIGDRYGINKIISFNFDDLLERALEGKGVDTQAICKPTLTEANKISIYHPHGYLPWHGGKRGENKNISEQKLVFTEDEFNSITTEPFNWAANELANTLRTSNGLFLGLSMNDPNLRRVMDSCLSDGDMPRQYLVRKSYDRRDNNRHAGALHIQDMARHEAEKRDFHRIGGDRVMKKGLGEVKKAMGRVTNQAEHYEEELFDDLNIETIWVKSYSDMPELIRQLSL